MFIFLVGLLQGLGGFAPFVGLAGATLASVGVAMFAVATIRTNTGFAATSQYPATFANREFFATYTTPSSGETTQVVAITFNDEGVSESGTVVVVLSQPVAALSQQIIQVATQDNVRINASLDEARTRFAQAAQDITGRQDPQIVAQEGALVPTPTPTPLPSATLPPGVTPSATTPPTTGPSPTAGPSPTVGPSPTAGPSPTPGASPTPGPSSTPGGATPTDALVVVTLGPSPTEEVASPTQEAATSTPVPTATVAPSSTPVPTDTPPPTATEEPTDTPAPTATTVPTDTPAPTATLAPTDTPAPTATSPPTNTPPPTPDTFGTQTAINAAATSVAAAATQAAATVMDHLVLAPSSATIEVGGSQVYTAQGSSVSGNQLGDVTSATTFSITPDGSCSGAICTASLSGLHTVTGNDGGKIGTASLTVNPVLTNISPNSVQVGAGDLALTATGSGFLPSSTIEWNGSLLATSFSSANQLTATVPAADFGSAGVGYVTIANPGAGAGSSAPQGVFVIPGTAAVVAASVAVNTASGCSPLAAVASAGATAAGSGCGIIAVAQFAADPAGAPGGLFVNGSYYDVNIASTSAFNSVTISLADPSHAVAYWWSGSSWLVASPQSFNGSTGMVTITVDATSSPSLQNLQGTPFAFALIGTTTSVASPSANFADASVNLSATVSHAPSDPINEGAVTFTVRTSGGTLVGSPVASDTVSAGAASVSFPLTVGTLPGTYAITADYAGGTFNGASSGSGTLTISSPPTPSNTPTPSPTATPTSTPTPTNTPADTPTPVPSGHISLSSGTNPLGFTLNSNMVAGGPPATAQLTVSNGTNVNFTYYLTVEATSPSILDQDANNPLQLRVLRCDSSFSSCTQIDPHVPLYYGALITTQNVYMGGPNQVDAAGDFGLLPGNQDYLEFEVTLPIGAGNEFQSQQSVVKFTFTAMQAT